MWIGEKLLLDLDELMKITRVISKLVDFRSRFTALHSSGVAAVAQTIAKKKNWSIQDCTKIKIAGYLHDIGKLAIPNSILEKNTKLTEKEYNLIKSHTYYSYYLLDTIESLDEINQYASLHHERLDGSGYPFHYNRDTLKEGSRIMAVADVFTAITEDRPYRKGMSKDDVFKIMKNMADNNSLDSNIVLLLMDYFNEINNLRDIAQSQALLEYEDFTKKINNVRSYYYEEENFNNFSFSHNIHVDGL